LQLPALPQTSATTSYLLATTYHTLLDHYISPASTRWDISAFQGALYGLGSTYVSGVLDNSRTTLTSAERERPGQNGHANSSSMGSSTGIGMHGGLGGSALGNAVLGGGVGGMGVGGMVGLGGIMSPNQSNMHTGQSGHLATAQHYAQLQLAAAVSAGAGGHGHHGMGSMLPMHHAHGLHHGHHHGHAGTWFIPLLSPASRSTSLTSVTNAARHLTGALPSGLSHLSNQASLGSNSLGGASSGTSANPSVQTPGSQPQSQGLLAQGQTPGQAGQNVYGMVPGSYVPGYMGQMGVGMGGVGGYGVGGMGSMGYFGRDR